MGAKRNLLFQYRLYYLLLQTLGDFELSAFVLQDDAILIG